MKDQPRSTMPVVEDGMGVLDGGRELSITNIYEMDGVSGYQLYPVDFPPYEVTVHGGGDRLTLNEQQTRELYRQIGKRITKWDEKG